MKINQDSTDRLKLVTRRFAHASASFDEFAEVHRHIGERMQDRLDLLAIKPQLVLDLGCGTGRILTQLRTRYRKARILGLDLSTDMLKLASRQTGRWRSAQLVAADAHSVPIVDNSVDLVISNLMLPWCNDPHQVIAEMFRILKPGGTVLFSTVGPDTLLEYRTLWQQIDGAEHAFGLTDMHDLGDSMLNAGFAAPVLDRENLTIDYPSVAALEHELHSTGAANIAVGRRRGLISPDLRRRFRQSVTENGRFSVTLELLQGHAWKGAVETGIAKKSDKNKGEFSLSVDLLRKGLDRWK